MELNVLLIDGSGGVSGFTSAAGGEGEEDANVLFSMLPSDMLAAQVARILSGEAGADEPAPMTDSLGRCWSIGICRLPDRPGRRTEDPAVALIFHRGGESMGFLRERFHLTPSELDIARALCRGEGRAEIASRRGVSSETLRGQIKSIYAKTGVDSEASLMRMIFGMCRPRA